MSSACDALASALCRNNTRALFGFSASQAGADGLGFVFKNK